MEYQRTQADFCVPKQVTELLDGLTKETVCIFRESLVGLYVRGSLATGDFDPETSDVDVLVILEKRVDDDTFRKIEEMHGRLVTLHPRYGPWLEATYVDRAAIRSFTPDVRQPTLLRRKPLVWHPHGCQWLLDYATARECGIALRGPAISSLIDPIPQDRIKNAIRERLREWTKWASNPGNPDWQLPNSHKSYVVATMCRALYALECNVLASKVRSTKWAIDIFPEPCRTTVERSRVWLRELQSDLALVPEVQRFVFWASTRGTDDASQQEL